MKRYEDPLEERLARWLRDEASADPDPLGALPAVFERTRQIQQRQLGWRFRIAPRPAYGLLVAPAILVVLLAPLVMNRLRGPSDDQVAITPPAALQQAPTPPPNNGAVSFPPPTGNAEVSPSSTPPPRPSTPALSSASSQPASTSPTTASPISSGSLSTPRLATPPPPSFVATPGPPTPAPTATPKLPTPSPSPKPSPMPTASASPAATHSPAPSLPASPSASPIWTSGQRTLDATNESGTVLASVTVGQSVTVWASGTWCTGGIKQDGSASCGGPEGIRPADAGETGVLLPSAPIGTLIGRIGTGPWFVIGTGATFAASQDGDLIVTCNDRAGFYADNSGSIQIQAEGR